MITSDSNEIDTGWRFYAATIYFKPVSYTHLDVYKRQIANSGTVALSGVKVTAPLFGRFWCNTIGNLDVGRAVKFSFSYTIPDQAPPVLENVAQVIGTAGTEEVRAEAVHRVELNLSLIHI